MCPNCNIPFSIKKDKWGREFLACQNFPECRETARIDGFVPTTTGEMCTEKDCGGEIMNQKNKKTGELFESCNNWMKLKRKRRKSRKK